MKLRNVISLFVALVMLLSFGAVASAKTENLNAEIYYDIATDEYGYYTATIMLKMDDPGLNLYTETAGRDVKYYGSGLYAFTFTINDADIYQDAPITSALGDYTGNFKDGAYNATISFATVAKLVKGASPIALATLATNYEASKMSEEDVIAAMSDFGYCTLKVATFDGVGGATVVSNDYVTTYAVSDGVEMHVDADYPLITPETPVDDEEDDDDVNVIVPTDVKDVTADTVNGGPTDYQIGSGLGMTVNTDATFTKMKWAITTAEGRLFSKTIALPNVTGEFKVAATFINGVHANGFGIDEVAAVEFSEVGAIFTDGNADWFTNADDAEYKNK